eukprot:TRINITY_DN2107_c0_g1_i1.p1 TRINITY_DN2107_c0_g1~~TRINITY_DN2107_c0_g1_i1.p1  ORF type:complete len:983 (-),score=260.35 TRINITY_DN2107_c0_g1_i1:394-3342(-)
MQQGPSKQGGGGGNPNPVSPRGGNPNPKSPRAAGQSQKQVIVQPDPMTALLPYEQSVLVKAYLDNRASRGESRGRLRLTKALKWYFFYLIIICAGVYIYYHFPGIIRTLVTLNNVIVIVIFAINYGLVIIAYFLVKWPVNNSTPKPMDGDKTLAWIERILTITYFTLFLVDEYIGTGDSTTYTLIRVLLQTPHIITSWMGFPRSSSRKNKTKQIFTWFFRMLAVIGSAGSLLLRISVFRTDQAWVIGSLVPGIPYLVFFLLYLRGRILNKLFDRAQEKFIFVGKCAKREVMFFVLTYSFLVWMAELFCVQYFHSWLSPYLPSEDSADGEPSASSFVGFLDLFMLACLGMFSVPGLYHSMLDTQKTKEEKSKYRLGSHRRSLGQVCAFMNCHMCSKDEPEDPPYAKLPSSPIGTASIKAFQNPDTSQAPLPSRSSVLLPNPNSPTHHQQQQQQPSDLRMGADGQPHKIPKNAPPRLKIPPPNNMPPGAGSRQGQGGESQVPPNSMIAPPKPNTIIPSTVSLHGPPAIDTISESETGNIMLNMHLNAAQLSSAMSSTSSHYTESWLPETGNFMDEIALIIACNMSQYNIGPTLTAALNAGFIPGNIWVAHNGGALNPVDPTGNVVRNDPAFAGIHYVYIPEGNKSIAMNYVIENYVTTTFVLMIDDDVGIPPNIDLEGAYYQMKLRPLVRAVAFTIRGIEDGNLWQIFQHIEYMQAGFLKLFQAQYGSVLACHGAIALWRTDSAREVFHHHNTEFHGEDLQMGLILRRMNKGYIIGVNALQPVPTTAPKSLFYETEKNEKSLLVQRIFSWDMAAHHFFLDFLEIMFLNWEKSSLILKPFLFIELWTLLQDWLRFIFLATLLYESPSHTVMLLLSLVILQLVIVITFDKMILSDRSDLQTNIYICVLYPMYNVITVIFRFGGLLFNALYFTPWNQPRVKMSERKRNGQLPPRVLEEQEVPPECREKYWTTVWQPGILIYYFFINI